MGYTKKRALEEIRVPMIVRQTSEDGSFIEEVSVAHVFAVPSPAVREEWQRLQLKQTGRKVRFGHRSDANRHLWLRTVLRVEGYDDLPTGEGWKSYFDDAIGRIHIDNAVDMLMEMLTADEGEQEKKLGPSSEQ